ncbi:hypothetical protein B0H14DRAFT_3540550 [Mycena olivaceomarginata]|nr:hypothetical protein B0H14DRAFT_3540550 [Mycena olivaceomarginata]
MNHWGPQLTCRSLIRRAATFICPTYLLLNALPGKAYKGEYAILPPCTTMTRSTTSPPSTSSAQSSTSTTRLHYAFTQGFVSFAALLDLNAKLRPSIAPAWQRWSRGAQTELVFHQTESGAPHIAPRVTRRARLE